MIKLNNLRLKGLLMAACVGLLAAGCVGLTPSPPAGPSPTPTDPQAVYTQAVQTVVAELTRAAGAAAAPTAAATAEAAPATTPLSTDSPASTPVPASPAPALSVTPPASSLTPTHAPPADDPRTTLAAPTLHETFDTVSGWAFSSDGHTQMDIRDGQLQMIAHNPDFWNGWSFAQRSAGDFYLEITAVHQDCSGLDRFGLIFRSPDYNSGYLLGLSCDGRYAMWTWNGSTEDRFLDWTSSPYIETAAGAANRLGVMARGSELALYANGYLLTQLTHEAYTAGRFGVFIGSAATPDYTVLVDELLLWENP